MIASTSQAHVPESVFRRGYDDTIEVAPGKWLTCDIGHGLIEIYPPGDGPIINRPHFLMALQRYLAPGTSEALRRIPMHNDGYILRGSVSARDPFDPNPNGPKYPGIEPARLLGLTVAYFLRNGWGSSMRFMGGNWNAPEPGRPYLGDNWYQYQYNLLSHGEPPYTDEQRKLAAMGTWTGQLAREQLGFDKIYSVDDDSANGRVVVLFERAPTRPEWKVDG